MNCLPPYFKAILQKTAMGQGSTLDRRQFFRVGGAVAAGVTLQSLGMSAPTAHAQMVRIPDDLEPIPIPDTARGPAIDPNKGYVVEELRPNLYWVGDGAYMMMFLTTGKGVIVVDAPPTLGERIFQAIDEVTNEPVTHLVYTHAHGDHIGAANLFPRGVEIIAHAETKRLLKRETECADCLDDRPLPTTTFERRYLLTVGRQRLLLDYRGPNHQPGNIFVYALRQRVLMLVDVIYPGWVPFQNLALAQDVPGFLDAYDQALAYPFDFFIGGHVTRPGTRRDVEIQREYIRSIVTNCRNALNSVDRPAFVGELGEQIGFDNPWQLFSIYTDAIAQAATEATLAEWGGRLGGVEVFTFSHCTAMQYSLRID